MKPVDRLIETGCSASREAVEERLEDCPICGRPAHEHESESK